jgi:hypothetical protein
MNNQNSGGNITTNYFCVKPPRRVPKLLSYATGMGHRLCTFLRILQQTW